MNIPPDGLSIRFFIEITISGIFSQRSEYSRPRLNRLAHWNLHHEEWVRLALGRRRGLDGTLYSRNGLNCFACTCFNILQETFNLPLPILYAQNLYWSQIKHERRHIP